MKVRLTSMIMTIAALVTSSSATSKPQHSIKKPVAGLPVSKQSLDDATSAILSCTEAGSSVPSECSGSWRGVTWVLAPKTWTAQLDRPTGVRWLVHCKYDAIDRDDRCFWETGDQFSIARGDGYATLVAWGTERFPGSQMQGRFDDEAAFSTNAENWSESQSTAVYRKMVVAKLLRYRWYSWPENLERGGRINLIGFADAAALMEALRYEFTVLRVLKRIPADQ